MSLAFVLDEHLRGPLWQAILRQNLRGELLLDVVHVGDAADLPLSSDDPAVLSWAERENRLLITEDRHSMAFHLREHRASGHHSPGILIPRTDQPMRILLECLVLISHAGEAADFADRIAYFP
jgi:Domain of unknown function (DUF5615)